VCLMGACSNIQAAMQDIKAESHLWQCLGAKGLTALNLGLGQGLI
jgi:hypothetical protein